MAGPADVGRDLGESRFLVDRSKVRELARTLFDDDPSYQSDDAASEAGFDAIPMPLTAAVLASHWAEGGAEARAAALGIDLKRLLHGESAFDYLGRVRCGDELVGRTVVESVSTRDGARGGTMTLVALVVEYRNQDGDLVLRRRDTLIERGA